MFKAMPPIALVESWRWILVLEMKQSAKNWLRGGLFVTGCKSPPYLFIGEISFRYCNYSCPWMSVQSKKLPKSSDRTYVRRMYRNIASHKMAEIRTLLSRSASSRHTIGCHLGGCVVSLIVVIDKHKHHYLNFTAYLLWCMRTSLHRENHCHILDKG